MAHGSRIRVLVVDDHPVVRQGLATLFSAYDDMELVGEAASGEDAVRLCAELRPDVVLMDLVLPGMSGAAATRDLLQVCPNVQVLALTSFVEEHLVQEALQAGASGYLLKDIAGDQLIAAIRLAWAGTPTLNPRAAQALTPRRDSSPLCSSSLTEREHEVLSLLAQGLTNHKIAARLHISRATVKTHVSSILAKLGTESRAEAVALALRQGLVSPDPCE